MGKLKALAPRLSTLKPHRIRKPETRQEFDRQRDEQPWRKWYRTARWAKLRWAVLTRDRFTCRMCGRLEGNTSKLVADHTVKHGGDEARFFDPAGIQCLCATCHSGVKQRAEHRAG